MTHGAKSIRKAAARPAVGSGGLVRVSLRFNRDNMELLEGILYMYCDSEDPAIQRVAKTARKRVLKALNDLANKTTEP